MALSQGKRSIFTLICCSYGNDIAIEEQSTSLQRELSDAHQDIRDEKASTEH
jgi:hypothetical protein